MLFGNLSHSLKKVFALAAAESQMMNHYYIGTEHLFNALCKTDDEVIREVFKEYDIDPLIRREIRASVGMGSEPVWGKEIIFTPRVNKISKVNDWMVKNYQLPTVEPIHLLLALLRGGDGVAVRLLKSKELDIENITSAIEEKIERQADKTKKYPSSPKTPFLNKYGRDLTLLARQGKIDPLIGRKEETRKIAQTLIQKKKNNPILVGDAGVGKTCIVEGLAQIVVAADAPQKIRDFRIVEVSMGTLVAGTKYRGEFEKRLEILIKESSSDPNTVLFIDEVHTMVGAGASGSGPMDAGNILKPALANGKIKCIGATTIAEYRKYIEKDSALDRRFQVVWIDEPSRDDTVLILKGIKPKFEEHHNLRIGDEIIEKTVDLTIKYLSDFRLPDKAIDVFDNACARKVLPTLSPNESKGETTTLEIDIEDVAKVISERCHVPVESLTKEESERLLKMETILNRRVIGQKHAVEKVAETVKSSKAGLKDPKKPIGVFLFLGPTGVGKTELVKALAEFLFGSEDQMIRLDMSEYKEKHSVAKLIGAPPGYIGYEEEGQLTGKLRRKPYTVVLLDEIEKAHTEVFDMFLQVFDEGRLTDSKGRTINATNSIFVMTSNIQSESVPIEKINIGFQREKEKKKEKTVTQLKNYFRPEFLNRIDEIVIFKNLEMEELKTVASNMIGKLQERLEQQMISLRVKNEVLEVLCREGYTPEYGARPLARTIERLIVQPLSQKILKHEFTQGDTVEACLVKDEIIFQRA